MAKFILLYRGDATPPDQMTEAQSAEIMRQWNAWTEKHSSALVDIGKPFAARASVGGDGSRQTPANLNGYTIVEADDLEAATAFCDGHPFLRGTGPEFAIDVFELLPMDM
jgi:hypothetical protein